MAYWLMKSEPGGYSIDDLKRDKTTLWEGVRNYQARNFMMSMEVGDLVLFYHSSSDAVGVAGLAKVTSAPDADPSQFDKRSDYFDEKATKEKPRWFCPRIGFVQKFAEILPLEALRKQKGLAKMQLLQRGNRLSVLPVSAAEFKLIVELCE